MTTEPGRVRGGSRAVTSPMSAEADFLVLGQERGSEPLSFEGFGVTNCGPSFSEGCVSGTTP